MKIFTAQQTHEIDQFTIFNEPIKAIDLMERAAKQCSLWLVQHFDRSVTFKIFCGSGNNGGDGFAIARQLAELDYTVSVFHVKLMSNFTAEASENMRYLIEQNKVKIFEITSPVNLPQVNSNEVIVDALLGSGISRPLSGLAAECISYLNQCNASKIAIDIPSGLFTEENPENLLAFKAQHTLTFQYPFLSFLFAENEEFVGEWHVLPIGLNKKEIEKQLSPYQLVNDNEIIINSRKRFGHKGIFGHAILFAGSYGMAGAAVLASKACLRGGCGLLTTHIPRFACNILQTAVPEAILSIDMQDTHLTEMPDIENFQAIGIGPGIGKLPETHKLLKQLLEKCKKPIIIDADGLNILAQNPEWMKLLPENSILSPHIREFDRIAGTSTNSYERLQKARTLAQQYKICIVLKGANTCIINSNGNCVFNTTGNAGMATAGSGDVLTGLILSLLAQSYPPINAAIIGVYIHGKAGDIATAEMGQQALIASDIVDYLGKAFISKI